MTGNKKPEELVAMPMKFNDLESTIISFSKELMEKGPTLGEAQKDLKLLLDHSYFEDYTIKGLLKKGLEATEIKGMAHAIIAASQYIIKEYKEKGRELNWTAVKHVLRPDISDLKQTLLEFILLIMVGEDLKKVQKYLKNMLDCSHFSDKKTEKILLDALEVDTKSDFMKEIGGIIISIVKNHGA